MPPTLLSTKITEAKSGERHITSPPQVSLEWEDLNYADLLQMALLGNLQPVNVQGGHIFFATISKLLSEGGIKRSHIFVQCQLK